MRGAKPLFGSPFIYIFSPLACILRPSNFQEILKYILPRRGHEGFGVELDALHRVLAVAQPHNGAVLRPGGYLKSVGQPLALYYQ